MKKYILIIGLLITSLTFAQGGYTKPVVTAINVTIADAGAIITATEVENALQENRALINLNTIPHLEFNNTDKTVWNNGLGNESSNTSFGDGALISNTTGAFVTANGGNALGDNTTGSNNTASGNGALGKTTEGDFNTAFGAFALGNNILGGSNTAIGDKAGYRLHNDITANSSPSASVFIGKSTRALTNNDINQIVIGYNALGQGTNTVVLGNDDITDTYLKGNINGGAFIKNGGLSTEFLKADGSVSTGGGGGASFKEYTATLAQTSTNAPVAIVVFNDLGQVPTWTRTGVGLYSLTVTGNAWVLNKTIVHLTNANTGGGGLSGKVSSTATIEIYAFLTSTGVTSDNWEGTITVKVYD